MLAIADAVNVEGLDTDTGAALDGAPIPSLLNPGTIIKVRDRPPMMANTDENPNPSEHFLVRLLDASGAAHDAWFCGPRVTAT